MVRKFIFITCLSFFSLFASAQYVSVKLNFPVRSYSPSPFSGAVWIGPEWRWQGGKYISVPGRWVRNRRHGAKWIPGYWKRTNKGYIWVPGGWRR